MVKISVVIPVYNERENIVSLLNSLYYKSSQIPNEVIVVDGKSTDDTIHVIEKWKMENNINSLKIVKLNERAYPGRARNIGVKESSNEYIVFIDCCIIPSFNWLEIIHKELIKGKTDVVWGKSLSKGDTNWERAFAGILDKKSRGKFVRSSGIKKNSFLLIGGFNENLRAAEDLLYINAIKDKGLVETFVEADAWYSGYPKTLKEARKKWANYTKHTVFAGLYYKKMLLVLIQLLIILSVMLISYYKYNLIVGILFLITLNILRVVLSNVKSPSKFTNIKQFFYANFISISIDLGRINGLFTGLYYSKLK